MVAALFAVMDREASSEERELSGGYLADLDGATLALAIRLLDRRGTIRSMAWLPRWRRTSGPSDEERRALEAWVRFRFRLALSDPMIAIIGAFGRLTNIGIDEKEATETVLRVMRESEPDGRA